jgi:hypothetical protein
MGTERTDQSLGVQIIGKSVPADIQGIGADAANFGS